MVSVPPTAVHWLDRSASTRACAALDGRAGASGIAREARNGHRRGCQPEHANAEHEARDEELDQGEGGAADAGGVRMGRVYRRHARERVSERTRGELNRSRGRPRALSSRGSAT